MTCRNYFRSDTCFTGVDGKCGTNVSGNVSGHITTLGLNDGEGSQGSTAELLVHLGRTLQKTGVEVEDITGVSLTTRRTTEQERHLTVGNGLLRQIVIDDQGYKLILETPRQSVTLIAQDLPCLPLSRNHSPIAQPEKGARYCKGAASEAVAATMMVYFMASFSSRV